MPPELILNMTDLLWATQSRLDQQESRKRQHTQAFDDQAQPDNGFKKKPRIDDDGG